MDHPSDSNRSQISKLMQESKSVQTDAIAAISPENKLNTVELITDFYMEVYKRETAKRKINESVILETVSDLPTFFTGLTGIERCSYVFSYATCHTLLVKDCVTRFLKEYSNSADLIDSWRSDLNVTSLSSGPCVDCVAFNLAVLEVDKDPYGVSINVSVLSNEAKWLKTVRILFEVLREVKTPLNMKYVTPKVTLDTLFSPVKPMELPYLQSSNVVLMFSPFALEEVKEPRGEINEFVKSLKSGALIFSITSYSQSSEMQNVLKENQGSFLYGPTFVRTNTLIVEVPGKPTKSVPINILMFFVWVKDFDPFAPVCPKCPEKVLQPSNTFNEGVSKSEHAVPLDIVIGATRNGLKKVKMSYTFHADPMQDFNSLLKSKGTQTDLVSEAVLVNKLDTNRLVTDFFMEVFKSEVAQFDVRESIDLLLNHLELSSSRADFDDPHGRCAYMYYYATCHTLLMKECMVRFLTAYPNMPSLLEKWRSNPNHCSLSQGPGLDYIAFSLAVLEVSKQPAAVTKARIVGTHDNWKFTVDILSEVIQKVKTPLNLIFNLRCTHQQDLSGTLTAKTVKYLMISSVVFMFKTLNSDEKGTRKYSMPVLIDIVKLLATGTLIFFMDSPTSSNVMKKALRSFHGKFLYGPTFVISKDLQIEVSEELKNSMQLIPDQKAKVEFFVWEKISNSSFPLNQKPKQSFVNLQTSSSNITPGSADKKQLHDSPNAKSSEKIVISPDENQIDVLTRLFMEVYEKEMNKFGKSYPLSSVLDLSSTFEASFNAARFRCAYMYRYATCHTLLIKDCISRFLTGCSSAETLLERIRLSNSNICSLSLGPGLDYVAFSLAVLEHTKQPVMVAQFNILAKCIGWRDTFNILSDVVKANKTLIPHLDFSTTTFLKASVFEKLGPNAVDCLRSASMLLMFKSLDLDEKEKVVNTFHLRGLVSMLHVGTVIFFIDTPHSSKIMRGALANQPGSYLYGPISVSCNNIPIGIPGELKKLLGVLPVQSASADLFVWEKHWHTPSESHRNSKQNIDFLEIKSSESSPEIPEISEASSFDHEGKEVIPSGNGAASFPSTSSSENRDTMSHLRWRIEQKRDVKVGNKDKITEHLSSDISKKIVSSDHEGTSSFNSGSTPSNEKELNPPSTVVSKSLTKLKELIEPSCKPDNASVVGNSFELGASKPMIESGDDKNTSEPHPTYHLSAESTDDHRQVSDPSASIEPTKGTLTDHQEDKIKSLIARIDRLSKFIENDFEAPSEGSVNLSEINKENLLLTKRINRLVSSLETRDSHQTSETRCYDGCSCYFSCKCFSCHNNCDRTGQTSKPLSNFKPYDNCVNTEEETDWKSDKGDSEGSDSSSDCLIASSQCLGQSDEACCEHQPSGPSIVIPLENITPELLSLILTSKK